MKLFSPLFLLVLNLVLLPGGWIARPLPARADVHQQRHALADQVIAAYGGIQRVAQQRAQAFSGAATLQGSGLFGKRPSQQTRPVTLIWQGPSIRIELAGGAKPVALGRNECGWIQLGDKIFPSEDAAPLTISRQLECLPIFMQRLSAAPTALRGEGYARIGKEWFDVASMSDPENGPTYVVLDRKTHLIRRMFGKTLPAIAYDDYRTVSGIATPFKYSHAEPLERTRLRSGEKLPGPYTPPTVLRSNGSVEPFLAFSAISETELMPQTMPQTTPQPLASSPPIAIPIIYRQGKLLISGTINGAKAYFAVSNELFTTVDAAAVNGTSTVDIALGAASIKLSKPQLKPASTAFRIPQLPAPVAVLGQDFLRNFSAEFSLPRRSLTLYPNTTLTPSGSDTISAEQSILDTDLITCVTAGLPLPLSIDVGSPFSAFPAAYDNAPKRPDLPEGVRVPPPVLREPLAIDSKAIEIGYVRLAVLNYATVAFKKPVFAVSLTPGEAILAKERLFGVLGARNLRDNIVRFDYVSNHIKIFKLAEVEAREFFLSTLDDLQARHFVKAEPERILLYENLRRGAHETGNVNVEELARILCNCSPAGRSNRKFDPVLAGNNFDDMNLNVQLSRDRVAFGLLKALWCTQGCSSFDDHGILRQLDNAQRRAPEQPFILTHLAEAYINVNQTAMGTECLAMALKADPGFEDALLLAEKVAERAADTDRIRQIKEAKQFYAAAR